MKFCYEHWNEIAGYIEDLGLDDIIAKNGEQIAQRLASEINNGADWSNFDPLMYAHWALLRNISDTLGDPVGVLAHDGCPLCLLLEVHATQCNDPTCVADTEYRTWTYKAASDAKEEWLRLSGSV